MSNQHPPLSHGANPRDPRLPGPQPFGGLPQPGPAPQRPAFAAQQPSGHVPWQPAPAPQHGTPPPQHGTPPPPHPPHPPLPGGTAAPVALTQGVPQLLWVGLAIVAVVLIIAAIWAGMAVFGGGGKYALDASAGIDLRLAERLDGMIRPQG